MYAVKSRKKTNDIFQMSSYIPLYKKNKFLDFYQKKILNSVVM